MAQKFPRAPLALAISLLLSQSVLANSLEQVDRSLFDRAAKHAEAQQQTRRINMTMRALPSTIDAKSLNAESAARAHLGQVMASHQAGKSASEAFVLQSVSPMGNGASIVQFKRRINGIEVFREDVGLLLDANFRLVAFRGREGLIESSAKSLSAFALGSRDAVGAALSAYGFDAGPAGKSLAAARVDGDYEWFEPNSVLHSAAGPSMREPARVKAVYFPDATKGLIPAWYVETRVQPDDHSSAEYYAHVISAVDGSVLFRNFQQSDGVSGFTYRVWAESPPLGTPYPSPHGRNHTPNPTGNPGGPAPAYVLPNLVTLQHSIISTNDPWLAPGSTETTGNNTDAYADLGGADGFDAGDLRASTTAANTFDRTYDVTLEPGSSPGQRMAAVTQQFYWVNWLHDFFYDHGFAEVDGNAQLNNFSRGGIAGDRIRAEGQDFSGTDNANMATPADGGEPRMQMFVFSGVAAKNFQLNPAGGPQFAIGTASFGAQTFNVTSDIIRAAPLDGCSAFSNAVDMAGKIAFIDRGTCSFDVKALNAQTAGAVGAVIGNVASSGTPATPPNMGPSTPPTPGVTIATMSVNFADGEIIRATLGDVTPDTATMSRANGVGRDGTIDGSVISHEWGHYLSNRLIGDASGLSNQQGRGMGEGWGDFTAMMAQVQEADRAGGSVPDFSDTFAIGIYDTGDAYFGIRRYPYSLDLAKNPLKFRHIINGIALPAVPAPLFGGDGASNSEVHNTGEVWAAALWDCYAGLLNDTPRLSFQNAQDRMRGYLVGGLKLTPSAPTILEARDAVLAAIVVQSVPDFEICAAAFARRGMGILAVDAPRDSTTNVGAVEDTTVAADLAATSLTVDDSADCDNDGYLDLAETGSIDVDVQNTGWVSLATGTLQLTANHPGLAFTGTNPATLAATVPYASQTVSVPVQLNSLPASGVIQFTATPNGAILSPPGDAVSVFARVGANESSNASATERFDANSFGWTNQLDNGATAGFAWRRSAMDATGNRVAVGPDSAAAGTTSIISPPIAVGAGPFSISLTHRYQFEGGTLADPTHWDGGQIEISTDNGASWTQIGGTTYDGNIDGGTSGNPLDGQAAYVGTSVGYPATMVDTINLATTYANQTVKLRFTVGTDEAAGAPGWELHTVALTGAGTPFADVVNNTDVCLAPGELMFRNGFE